MTISFDNSKGLLEIGYYPFSTDTEAAYDYETVIGMGLIATTLPSEIVNTYEFAEYLYPL